MRAILFAASLLLAACGVNDNLAPSEVVPRSTTVEVGIVAGDCTVYFVHDTDPSDGMELRREEVQLSVTRYGDEIVLSRDKESLVWLEVTCLPVGEEPPEIWLDGGDIVQYCDWQNPAGNNPRQDCSGNRVNYFLYPNP